MSGRASARQRVFVAKQVLQALVQAKRLKEFAALLFACSPLPNGFRALEAEWADRLL